MGIGDNIKAVRKQKGLTQKQLGKLLGVSQAAIGQFENNKSVPQVRTLEKIANVLEIPTSQLLGVDYTIEDGFIFNFDDNNELKESEHGKFIFPSKRKTLLDAFFQLNADGQDKAIEQVELLTKIPEYKNDPDQDQEN